jgi:hypothetical protein
MLDEFFLTPIMQQRPFALQTLREALKNMDVIYATTPYEVPNSTK